MANHDIMCFLEYYSDRTNVVDPISGLRIPDRQWQNFYQVAQTFSIDTDVGGSYLYLAFDADGFGSVEAGSINDLSISIAAVADVVDLTEAAMNGDALVIASLIIQDAGFDSFDAASAQIISRYSGGLHAASIDETTVSWTVNPMINKTKAQIPTKKISSSILAKRQGQ